MAHIRRFLFTVVPAKKSCQNRNIAQNLNEILHKGRVVSVITLYTFKFIIFLKVACTIISRSGFFPT